MHKRMRATKLKGHEAEVRSVCFNSTSHIIASGSATGEVLLHGVKNQVWDIGTLSGTYNLWVGGK